MKKAVFVVSFAIASAGAAGMPNDFGGVRKLVRTDSLRFQLGDAYVFRGDQSPMTTGEQCENFKTVRKLVRNFNSENRRNRTIRDNNLDGVRELVRTDSPRFQLGDAYVFREEQTPTKDSPAKDALGKDPPSQDSPQQDSPTKNAPAKNVLTTDALGKDAPLQLRRETHDDSVVPSLVDEKLFIPISK